MKSELVEFMFHLHGLELPEFLHMRAPTGATILDPKPAHPFGHGYRMHPELSRPVYAGVSAYAFHNPYVAGIGVSAVPAVGVVMATSAYPEVAGPQYQSAMSGQMSIGSSAMNLPKRSDSRDYFTWSYWSANR